MEAKLHGVEKYPELGLTVSGPVPISTMLAAMKQAEKLMNCTEDQLVDDYRLARRLGVLAVFGTASSLAAWEKKLNDLPVKVVTAIPWLDEWIDRGDVGISSASIVSVCFNVPMAQLGMSGWLTGRLPVDAHDFTRCRKLVTLAAANGENLLTKLAEVPMWAPLVARWADLCEAEEDAKVCTAVLADLGRTR